jgi:hypothetical protein
MRFLFPFRDESTRATWDVRTLQNPQDDPFEEEEEEEEEEAVPA